MLLVFQNRFRPWKVLKGPGWRKIVSNFSAPMTDRFQVFSCDRKNATDPTIIRLQLDRTNRETIFRCETPGRKNPTANSFRFCSSVKSHVQRNHKSWSFSLGIEWTETVTNWHDHLAPKALQCPPSPLGFVVICWLKYKKKDKFVPNHEAGWPVGEGSRQAGAYYCHSHTRKTRFWKNTVSFHPPHYGKVWNHEKNGYITKKKSWKHQHLLPPPPS